jgi:taurine transport system permease protein
MTFPNVGPHRTGPVSRVEAAGSVLRRARSVGGRQLGQAGIRSDPVALARHRAEYAEPSIWLWRRIVGAAFAFIVVTTAWYLVKVPDGLVSDDALPSQTAVATALNEVRSDGFAGSSLTGHVGLSLFRLSFGLGLGSLAGVGLGVLIGGAPLVRTVIDPVSSFFRMAPGVVFGPLVVIWFGAGEATIVTVVALTVMWTSMVAVADAVARSARVGLADLPYHLMTGMRSSALVGWATVLAMETILASRGLGAMVWFAQERSDVIVVGIYLAALIGFTLDTLLRVTQYLFVTLVDR